MRLIRYDSVERFYARAEPFLLAHEADHNLPLGICSNLLSQPEQYDEPPYLSVVEEGGEVAAVAIRTSPFNVVLSLIDEAQLSEAAALLVAELHAAYPNLPGVLGPSAVSLAITEQWQAATGQHYRPGMRERIYQLTAVRPPQGVAGRMRRATDADRPLLEAWMTAFGVETGLEDDLRDSARWVDEALASPVRQVMLWENGHTVSLACSGARTPNGSRIGPVYTPPEERGHGYASACVAALSQLQLDQGRRFCFLFTDLANPTSNHIYQAIGYEPVSDVDMYLFGE
jgi:predicted GNAT family acetyltransferase